MENFWNATVRRVHASIKVGRRGKRNRETKGIQGGGALWEARLRPGWVSPGQESPDPEKQELHQSSQAERPCRELEQDPRRAGIPQAPWDTNRAPAPQERVPSSLKGCCARTAGPWSSSEAALAETPHRRGYEAMGAARKQLRRLCREGAAGPGSQFQ